MSDAAIRGPAVPRILVVGLDAAEPALLRRWCAAGHLPTLRLLLDGSAWGEVGSGSSHFPDTAMLAAYRRQPRALLLHRAAPRAAAAA